MDDYYEILQVSQRADLDVIKAAYNRLAFKYHPDQNQGNPSVEKVMKRLNEAWSVLRDPPSRSAYDRKREGEATRRAEQEKEEANRAHREKEATQQAEQKPKAPAQEVRRDKPTGRPNANAPRSAANSYVRLLNWPPGWVNASALIMASGGGLSIIICGMFALDIVRGGNVGVSWELIQFFLGGGVLAMVEGLGLNFGMSWAASVPMKFCLVSTSALGLLLVSKVIDPSPLATISFISLLVADLFFWSVHRALNKQRRSLR